MTMCYEHVLIGESKPQLRGFPFLMWDRVMNFFTLKFRKTCSTKL